MKLFRREKYLRKIRSLYDDVQTVKVISGIRGCGKSSLLKLIAEELTLAGAAPENLIHIDLDSDNGKKIQTGDQLKEKIDSQCCTVGLKYLFIDEIQNVDGFEEVINQYLSRKDYSIFLSVSGSFTYGQKSDAKLAKPYLEFEMFPLTFDEYLEMKTFCGRPVNPNLIFEFTAFLHQGGFPKNLLFERHADKQAYITELFQEIFHKDISQKIRIGNMDRFRKFCGFMLHHLGTLYNISSLEKAMRAEGIYMKRKTIIRYLDALLESRVLYGCRRVGTRTRMPEGTEKKYYLADPSFYTFLNLINPGAYNPLLENLVFIYGRSSDYTVYTGHTGKLKCDFILRDPELNDSYVQVAYTILAGREGEDRKYVPLEKIKGNYPKYVMTTDYLLQKRNGIRHMNLLEFMKDHQKF